MDTTTITAAIGAGLGAVYSIGAAVLLIAVAVWMVSQLKRVVLEDEGSGYVGGQGWTCENCGESANVDDVCDHCGCHQDDEALDWSSLEHRVCPNCEEEADPDAGRCYGCGLRFGDGSE